MGTRRKSISEAVSSALSHDTAEQKIYKMLSSELDAALQTEQTASFLLLFDGTAFWWWELFETARKLLMMSLILISINVESDSPVQVIAGLTIQLISIKLYESHDAIIDPLDNVLAHASQWLTLIILIFCLMLKVDVSQEAEADQENYGVIMIMCMFTLPTIILFTLLKELRLIWQLEKRPKDLEI